MKLWSKFLGGLAVLLLATHAHAQQQPVVSVDITRLAVVTGSGKVIGFTDIQGGGGYVSAPDVTITGGGGSGAKATATLTGVIGSLAVTAGGSGYTSAPTVTISGGGGSGARATALLTGDVVTSITVTNPGTGYNSTPIVTITGGGGSGASATAALDYVVDDVIVTDQGSGYTSVPTVAFSGGGGLGASVTAVIGTLFDKPNEAYGPARTPIQVEALGVGTTLVGSFTYSFFVNGVSIGTTTGAVAPPKRPVITWTPPQPGSYFITVKISDGVNTATSLPVRYFAEGTVVNSPVDNTLVPAGSSVVLKADATVALGFIKEIHFYDSVNGGVPVEIGTDSTLPYSWIYQPGGTTGTKHEITAQAKDNDDNWLAMSDAITLKTITAITPLPTCSIDTPADGSSIPISSVTVSVSAARSQGFVSKVELYVDGVLTGTKTDYPYSFTWTPTVLGTYHLVALAYDDKNNAIASPTNTVTVTSGSTGGTVSTALLSVSGISADPASAFPGDQVSFTIEVDNNDLRSSVPVTATASFTVQLTNIATGRSFTLFADALHPTKLIPSATLGDATTPPQPGTGSFRFTATIPTQFVDAGTYRARVSFVSLSEGTIGSSVFTQASTVLTVTGKPDLQITGLHYAAGTSYVGGDVIPMELTYRNNPGTGGRYNVPYLPGYQSAGQPSHLRIQVVLSGNPTYGDADDQQLTFLDITDRVDADGDSSVNGIQLTSSGAGYTSQPTVTITGGGSGSGAIAEAVLNAAGQVTGITLISGGSGYSSVTPVVVTISGGGGAGATATATISAPGDHIFRWNQVLPGNFSGSYYVLAKIDSLDELDENDPPVQTINGDNVWASNATNPAGTLINLLPSNFPTSALISHGTGALTSANRYSDNPAISPDGRYIAFASDATDLIAEDSNGLRDVFLYDNQTKLVRRLSVSEQGLAGNGASNHPSISEITQDNHYYVAFESLANNLVQGDNNGFSDIFVTDTVTSAVVRISVPQSADSNSAAWANGHSYFPSISADGRYVVFESEATNLVSPATKAGVRHVYLRDRDVSGSGVLDKPGNSRTILLDVTPGGVAGNSSSRSAVISPDGSHVGFSSFATNLTATATTAGRSHVYLRDLSAGTTKLVSVAMLGGEANGNSQTPALSFDGRYVAFASTATDLVFNDTNGVSDIFVADTSGAGPLVRVSEAGDGTQGEDPSEILPYDQRLGSINPSISANGRYVVFASLAANLAPGDAVGQYQGEGARATASVAGGAVTAITVTAPGTRYSQATPPHVTIVGGGAVTARAAAEAIIDADGHLSGVTIVDGGAGYTSAPTISITSDANLALDVFVHDRDVGATGTYDVSGNLGTHLVSVNTFGYQTSGLLGVASSAASNIYPVISGNGRYVAFPSDAENNGGLAFGDTNQRPLDSNTFRDVFLSDQRIPVVPSGNDFDPTVAITTPGSGSRAVVNRPVTLRASAVAAIGHIASVEFFVDGTSLGVVSTLDPDSNSYETSWTPLAAGSYSLSAIATDNYGDQGVSSNVAVKVNVPPTVSVTSLMNGDLLGAGTSYPITANAKASNFDSVITFVDIYANDVLVGTATAEPYTVNWTPPHPGSYKVTAVATERLNADGFEIATTSAVVNVAVGSTPSVVVSNPAAGASYLVGTEIPLTATTSGGYGAIAKVEFFINGDSFKTVTAAPFSTTWTPTAAGTYSVSAQVTDANGHHSGSTPFNVTITPNQAPTVKLTSPKTTTSLVAGDSIALSADADDVDGVVKSVAFVASGKVVGTATAKPFALTWTPGSAGTYSIVARATDDSGNVTTSAPAVTVKVAANKSPTVKITSPASGANVKVNANTSITATATDSDGTVASVRFYVNGSAIGAADTTAPYAISWKPAAEGTYRLTAVATDSSGASTTSATVTVVGVVASAANTDAFYFGNYQIGSEKGRFAAVNIHGYSASLLGYATNGAAQTRYYGAMPVSSGGGFSKGGLRGVFGATGVSGSIEGGVFIGTVTVNSTSLARAVGYYTGTMAKRHQSVVFAMLGGDGTIFMLVQDGAFRDIGEGHVSSAGTFSFRTRAGTSISGKANPASGLMSGRISGAIAATFTAGQPSATGTADGVLRSVNARATMGTGDNTLTVGFATTGGTKKLLLRAIGPSGKSVMPSGARLAADPGLKLYRVSGGNSSFLASNADWLASDAPTMAAVKAVPVLAAGSKDAALTKPLAKGSYSFQVVGNGGGLARAEIYDTDRLAPFAANRLVRVSVQARVAPGNSTLVGQFTINGSSPKRILVRGIGPALLKVDSTLDILRDPYLRLWKVSGSTRTLIRENDSWSKGNDLRLMTRAFAQAGATPGLATGGNDAAILITLPPATFQLELLGVNGTSGVGLLEVYELP